MFNIIDLSSQFITPWLLVMMETFVTKRQKWKSNSNKNARWYEEWQVLHICDSSTVSWCNNSVLKLVIMQVILAMGIDMSTMNDKEVIFK